MSEFAMAHPWMTFILIFVALAAADNMFGNWCRARISKRDKEQK